jgi:hypothetical protein
VKRALLVVPVLLVAACSGSSGGARAVETTAPPTPVPDSASATPAASPSAAPSPSASRRRPQAAPGDVDGDGRNEVWVETARGASTSFVQAYRYDGAALHELTYAGGHIRFGIGGSVTHADGFTCTDTGRLIVSTAESDDGTSYRVHKVTYRVSGATLVRVLETSATAPTMDDPRVRAAYQVDCGSVGESD